MNGPLVIALAHLGLAYFPTTRTSAPQMNTVAVDESPAPKHVLVPIADGSEEIETVCIVDTLVRAGAKVTMASVMETANVRCSRGVRITADALVADVADTHFDAIVVPGGMPGASHIAENGPFEKILKAHVAAERLYGAICAAPVVVLQKYDLLQGKKATAHPAFSDKLPDQEAVPSRVVVDGSVITSRGPGTALEFAVKVVELLYGEEKAKAVAGPMVMA